jgi:hypothetical protein
MELIGKGWQYRVYDLGNGRVRKVPRSLPDSFWRTFGHKKEKLYLRPLKSWKEAIRITRATKESVAEFHKHNVPPELIGNVFFEGVAYEQDKAIPLGEYLASHTVEEGKHAIAGYVALVMEFWKYGCADTVYNFTLNNAIDRSGRIIVIDIGEFAFAKDQAAADVRNKKWLGQSSYTSMDNTDLKAFFAREMERQLTPENLEKQWGIALPSSISHT